MKIFQGKVIATKMGKTATVVVERIFVHPIYKKRFKRISKYHVHDEIGVKVGEKVKFVASRPYSKLKKWKILEAVTQKESKKGKKK
jgi:small subunit ribosomal protein S17